MFKDNDKFNESFHMSLNIQMFNKKSSSIKSKKCKITHAFDQAKGQTKNVIISLLRDEYDLTNIEAVCQIINALNRPKYSWLDIVILVGKNDYIKIYKRK